MARFTYVAIDVEGRERSGALNAASEEAARAELVRRKLLPVRVAVVGAAPARNESAAPRSLFAARAPRLGARARVVVTRQLAALIDAAVPVDEALAMIGAQQENPDARAIVTDVRAGVVEGQRLADALARHPRSFGRLYSASVAGGERSGKLGFVLNRLAAYLGRADAMAAKITTALIYPSALLLVAFTVVTCLMIFVVPSLAEQFESFEARLPLLTQILIGVSGFLANFWALLLMAIGLGAYGVHVLMGREAVRARLDAWLMRAPGIGRWVVNVNASRFIRAVGTLVASGLPVLDAVRVASASLTNRAAARAAAGMADHIEQGESLSTAMRKSGVIPPMVMYMTASGENTGDLAGMLDKAADQLDQDFETFSTSALALLEPAIIVFMGAVVASIVLAIMLPVLQLNRLAIG